MKLNYELRKVNKWITVNKLTLKRNKSNLFITDHLQFTFDKL